MLCNTAEQQEYNNNGKTWNQNEQQKWKKVNGYKQIYNYDKINKTCNEKLEEGKLWNKSDLQSKVELVVA